jgi:hypothetical protein
MAADYIVDLPLQVKDDGIYWNNSSSGSAVESNDLVVNEEEICIWRRHQQCVILNEDRNPSPWYDRTRPLLLCTHAKQEEGGRTTYKINEAKLLEIIRSHKGSNASCAKHVAMISNDHRPTLALPFASPATLLQQLVFPPITGLLYAFDPELYAADSVVYTGIYTFKDRDGHRAPLTGTTVDAALTFSDQHLVLAMLELDKAAGRAHDHDDSMIMQKCVLLTSLSALALAREGGIRSVAIPFVVNVGVLASLYTTTVEQQQPGSACPAVTVVFQADLSDASDTARMVAYLAVILHALKRDIEASERARRLRTALSTFRATSARSNRHPPTSSNRTESMGGGASDPSGTGRRRRRS